MQTIVPGSSLFTIIKRDWKNWANLVTITRAIGTLAIPFLVLNESSTVQWWGFGLFVFLALTDKLDGWLAKRITGTTELGKMLDPLVDKELILVTLGAAFFVAIRADNPAVYGGLIVAVPILIMREIAVLRIKTAAQQRDGRVESAIESGRVSMVVQSVATAALIMPIDRLGFQHMQFGLLFAAVCSSLFSWWDYHRTYRAADA